MVCKAYDCKRKKICGCFMDHDLHQQGKGWRWYCLTGWEQLHKDASANPDCQWLQDKVRYYEEFFHGRPVSAWPTFGCGSRYMPWARSKPDLDICRLRFADEHGKVTDEILFCSHQLPSFVKEVFRTHQDKFFKVVDAMPDEELKRMLPKCYRNSNPWAPEGCAGIKGVGYLHLEENNDLEVMTTAGWANMFMSIASKNLCNLAPGLAMGADMLKRPDAYSSGRLSIKEFYRSIDGIHGWTGPLAGQERSRSPSPEWTGPPVGQDHSSPERPSGSTD